MEKYGKNEKELDLTEESKEEDDGLVIELIPEPISEIEDEVEELVFDFGTSEKKKRKSSSEKPKITYENVQTGIRKKLVDGKLFGYEAYINWGKEEVYDEKKKQMVTKRRQKKQSFSSLGEARHWRLEMENQKDRAKKQKREVSKKGVLFMDVAKEYEEHMARVKTKTASYLDILRIHRENHFKDFFVGPQKAYVSAIQQRQINEYFEYLKNKGLSKSTITQHRSHLKKIWDYMLEDKVLYGISENVVVGSNVYAKNTDFQAIVLNDKQINELIYEACNMEDPTFLYIVVFSVAQGMRRGELCGLRWQDINFETKRVKIMHSRIQVKSDVILKKPKGEKTREIELHKASLETLMQYKEWQEKILEREVKPDEFVLRWKIDVALQRDCNPETISKRWGQILKHINKQREKDGKEKLPMARLHDNRHTYITLMLQGIRTDDKIIRSVSPTQVYYSAGHNLPLVLRNTSEMVYNNDIGNRWEVTAFWNEVITVDIKEEREKYLEKMQTEEEAMTEEEKAERERKWKSKVEKAERERKK